MKKEGTYRNLSSIYQHFILWLWLQEKVSNSVIYNFNVFKCSKVFVEYIAHHRYCNKNIYNKYLPHLKDQGSNVLFEASRGAGAQSVTVRPTGCGFDPRSMRWNIYLNLYFHFFTLVSRQSAALSSATQHAMPPEFGRKWRTECLNIRFPLSLAYLSVCGIQREADLFYKMYGYVAG